MIDWVLLVSVVWFGMGFRFVDYEIDFIFWGFFDTVFLFEVFFSMVEVVWFLMILFFKKLECMIFLSGLVGVLIGVMMGFFVGWVRCVIDRCEMIRWVIEESL